MKKKKEVRGQWIINLLKPIEKKMDRMIARMTKDLNSIFGVGKWKFKDIETDGLKKKNTRIKFVFDWINDED